MLRFHALEQTGMTVAAMSGTDDGDCSSRPEAEESRRTFLRNCGIEPSRLARARQVHGTVIHPVDKNYLRISPENVVGSWPPGDGLVTNIPGIALGISVADCVPLWIVDPVRLAIGLFHAGRDGTVAGIAAVGVLAMTEKYGCLPGDLVCIIGPSVGPCCYELSADMAGELSALGFPVSGRNLDLWETNRRQLVQCGIVAEHITVTQICTLCGTGFHSYRKSGTAKRNLAVGMI